MTSLSHGPIYKYIWKSFWMSEMTHSTHDVLLMINVGYPNKHWGMVGSRVMEVLLLTFDMDTIHKNRATHLF